ncbi:ABC transporter substrate-binding protein [Roseibium sp. RKSG952]|uniref:ABC transporter substrate-binding protein n=1 Tax=Roseibium sp. RKSG952 TaxID=2529384 RepID=UPI0012BC4A9E|nr:ABC transporter substrate-binding protein [Roseibium sp. RKSG952]MTH95636.1 iron-siderophore ABC transporter substrate-binding protein [Roseibium sp. RKSG952]
MSIDRRLFLGGLAGLAASATVPALAGFSPRIVSLDYAAAETLISLGAPPVGIQSADRWQRWVVEPGLPEGVVNVGQDLAVNLEVIAALKPDMILTTPYTDSLRKRLSVIAPVHKVSVYDQSGTPLVNAYRETGRLGQLAERPAAAARFLETADAEFSAMRDKLAKRPRPPVTLVNFMDNRHVRVYGKSGLYQDVLDRLGLTNAWTRPTNYWGFATVGLEELARQAPSAMHLIAFEPIVDEIRPTLASSPIWRRMPVVEQERFTVFPPVLTFGMVPSALRFARLITNYLEGQGQ